jgi:hypothetical protein
LVLTSVIVSIPFKMLRVFIVLMVLSYGTVSAQDALLSDIRENIEGVFKTEEVCLRLHQEFESADISQSILLQGYKGGVLMGMARHHINPFKKMSFFNDGKKLIESAISIEPENLELRFLRLTIQTNLPEFLGYSESKKKDKAFVLVGLEKEDNEMLKKRMRNFISAAEEQGKL